MTAWLPFLVGLFCGLVAAGSVVWVLWIETKAVAIELAYAEATIDNLTQKVNGLRHQLNLPPSPNN